jgi:hypothetical protein
MLAMDNNIAAAVATNKAVIVNAIMDLRFNNQIIARYSLSSVINLRCSNSCSENHVVDRGVFRFYNTGLSLLNMVLLPLIKKSQI